MLGEQGRKGRDRDVELVLAVHRQKRRHLGGLEALGIAEGGQLWTRGRQVREEAKGDRVGLMHGVRILLVAERVGGRI